MFSLPLAPSCGSLPNTRFFPLLSAPPEKRWQCINSNDCAKRPIYKWLTKTEINVRAKDRSRITWCLFATVSHCCMVKDFFCKSAICVSDCFISLVLDSCSILIQFFAFSLWPESKATLRKYLIYSLVYFPSDFIHVFHLWMCKRKCLKGAHSKK